MLKTKPIASTSISTQKPTPTRISVFSINTSNNDITLPSLTVTVRTIHPQVPCRSWIMDALGAAGLISRLRTSLKVCRLKIATWKSQMKVIAFSSAGASLS